MSVTLTAAVPELAEAFNTPEKTLKFFVNAGNLMDEEQRQILKDSIDEEVTLNENNYGVFVNLSDLSDELLEKIQEYISYWKTQENNLKNIETKKEKYKTIYFSKTIKDNSSVNNNAAEQSI